MNEITTQCCIVGGGPAGMKLGLLLARAGVNVIVLEKHADFLRDFRGDTIHPSTMEILYELGVLDEFLRLPHQEVANISAKIGSETFRIADVSRLRTHCRFVALMPQWDFLNFVADQAQRYPNFTLLMQTEATALSEHDGIVAGVEARMRDGPHVIRAELVVGADGRHSIVRESAGLKGVELGAPMDVMWFRLARRPADPAETAGRVVAGALFIQIYRGEHWQCGLVIPKGANEAIRQGGLESFRGRLAEIEPTLKERVSELRDWEQIKLLTVQVDRLTRWYRPGLLCLGDAAHAMSPIGGVGVNLAIQDAVAAANVIAAPLRFGKLTVEHLERVQRRRMLPTRVLQNLHLTVQKRVIARVLDAAGPLTPPLALRIARRIPLVQRITGRLIGLGFRPEHVESFAVTPTPL